MVVTAPCSRCHHIPGRYDMKKYIQKHQAKINNICGMMMSLAGALWLINAFFIGKEMKVGRDVSIALLYFISGFCFFIAGKKLNHNK